VGLFYGAPYEQMRKTAGLGHAVDALSSLSAPRTTIFSASSGNGRCSTFASSLIYGFLTTAPNSIVEPIHPNAMPVTLYGDDVLRILVTGGPPNFGGGGIPPTHHRQFARGPSPPRRAADPSSIAFARKGPL
jgi:hypothetical protein